MLHGTKHSPASRASDGSAALVVDRVTKRFDDFVAVNDLSLTVKPGRIYGLLGPNGAGKTTTIRMIVNITMPDSGRIELFGNTMNARLQDRIGYLPEERGLYKKMRVGEQLRFFGEMKGMSGKDADDAITRWLDRMKLTEWRRHKTDELSKGMQQKIQFVATVMHEPELVVLDEPFSGLDPVNAQLLKEIVLDLKRANRAIIFSTHQMEQAEQMCDDICLINRSRKVLEGSIREVKRAAGRRAVALRLEGETELVGQDGTLAPAAPAALRDPSLVASVRRNGEHAEAMLTPEADAQELLRRLVAEDVRIARFESVEPSLHEIFIAQVGAAEAGLAANGRAA